MTPHLTHCDFSTTNENQKIKTHYSFQIFGKEVEKKIQKGIIIHTLEIIRLPQKFIQELFTEKSIFTENYFHVSSNLGSTSKTITKVDTKKHLKHPQHKHD